MELRAFDFPTRPLGRNVAPGKRQVGGQVAAGVGGISTAPKSVQGHRSSPYTGTTHSPTNFIPFETNQSTTSAVQYFRA